MVWYHFSYSVPQSWTTDIWDLAQRGSDIQAEISRCIAGNNSLALRPGLLLSCCLNPVFLNRYFAWRTSNYEFVWEKHILQYVWKRVRDQYREQCFKTHREISQKTTRNIYAVEKFCKYLKFGWYTTGLSPYYKPWNCTKYLSVSLQNSFTFSLYVPCGVLECVYIFSCLDYESGLR